MAWNARARVDAAWAALGAACAAVPALSLWGFTVDDALIPLRYARHLAEGHGWRFDVGASPSDGVTPLPWPLVLAPLARAAPLDALARAQMLGLVVWSIAAAVLGVAIGRAEAPRLAKGAALVALACAFPVAAHAVTGMETAVTLALATIAAVLAGGRRAFAVAAVAGLAAAFRPEMAPWAAAVAGGTAALGPRPAVEAKRAVRIVVAVGVALVPFVACAATRLAVFGRAGPLALLAKPSDPSHGAWYAAGAFVGTAAPLLACAPVALARARGPALVLALAALAHFAALALAGGDWMPYWRLAVPIAPSLVYAYVLASPRAHPASTYGRALVAIGIGVALFVSSWGAARRVGADRAAVADAARPALAGATRVAAVDIGWLSAAVADDADIVDLAGLTDPAIAALPGGHTSKRVGPEMLLDRRPDALVFYAVAPVDLDHWARAVYPHAVEARLAREPLVDKRFRAAAWVPLGDGATGYVIVRR